MKRRWMLFLGIMALAAAGCGGKKEAAPAAAAESTVKESTAKESTAEESAAETPDAGNAGTAEKTGEGASVNGAENLGYFEAKASDGVIEMPTFGMKVTLPGSMRSEEFEIAAVGSVDPDLAYANIYLVNEDSGAYSAWDLVEIVARRGTVDPDEYVNPGIGLTREMMKDLGTNGTLSYIGVGFDELYAANPVFFEGTIFAGMTDAQKERYLELLPFCGELLESVELTELVLPEPPKAQDVAASSLMDMAVSDLDGNPARLGDLIAENKVTMLNFWGTFCGPCINEMPDLGDLERAYKDQGFEILGITGDVIDPSGNLREKQMQDARNIIEDTGITYPVLIPSPELLEYVDLVAYPTTYFVDSRGNMLGEARIGSMQRDAWENLIREYLADAEAGEGGS